MPKPLFVTGVARSGTTLLARLLTETEGVRLALDPFLPLFRSFRDAAVRDAGLAWPPAGAPLQDYYFRPEGIAALDAVLTGTLDTAIGPAEWEDLERELRDRAAQEAPELVDAVPSLAAPTYQEAFARALAAVRAAHGSAAHVGWKDVWILEFAPALAHAWPDARFVVIVRDPRAIVASLQAMAARDPSQAGHPLSYARHWRKEVALVEHLRRDPSFREHLHVVSYERLAREPLEELAPLATFLGVTLDGATTGFTWAGNSSFRERLDGVDAAPVSAWREHLATELMQLVELVCGPEMRLAGYELDGTGEPDESVLAHLVASDRWDVSWRSDLGDPRRDFELEASRKSLLATEPSREEVRLAFLFEDVHAALRHTLQS